MARVLLKNVRLAFPDLFQVGKPVPGSTSAPKFGGSFIFSADSESGKAASAEFLKVATEKFGPNAAVILAELPKDKKCIRRGDGNLDKSGVVRDGFAGMLYIRASNKIRPVVVDENKAVLVEADGKPYGGCYVHAVVDIYAHDKPGLGKRVDATLLSVMFAGAGDRFGGSVGDVSDFDDIPADVGSAPAVAAADLF